VTEQVLYKPREYWQTRGRTFIGEDYQRGLYWEHEWILGHLKVLRPRSILEIGCGFGRNLRFLKDHFGEHIQCVGLDFSPSMLSHAQRFLGEDSPPLVNGDATRLPFADASFDVVLVHGVFMHIPPQQIAMAFSEIHRVTKLHVLQCEENYGGRRPNHQGVVRINEFTFAYDYLSRFERSGFLVADHRRVGPLDGFLLKKRIGKYDVPGKIRRPRLGLDGAHSLVLAAVPVGSRVLDVGCATGYLGQYLIEHKSCVVEGVEPDTRAAAVAERSYRRVWVGSVEDEDLLMRLHGPYDVVMCPAVLEHLRNPEMVVRRLCQLIAPGGLLLATLPNVAHWSLRWEHVLGRWEYTDYGLLDRTHLRFYTLRTGRRMLEDAGYRVEGVQFSNVGLGPLEPIVARLPRGRYRVRRWLLSRFPSLFGFEMLFTARPGRPMAAATAWL
jgi:SAM-dependent methyltransferase